VSFLPGRLSSFGCNNGGSCEKYSAGSDSLQSLGFTINVNKSLLIPTQVITFLGFRDRLNMHDDITPSRKGQQHSHCCRSLLLSQSIKLRHLASLMGLLETSRPAIWRAPLHFRHLQSDLIRGLQMNQESLRRFGCPVTECQCRTCLVVETNPQCKRESRAPSSAGYDHNN